MRNPYPLRELVVFKYLKKLLRNLRKRRELQEIFDCVISAGYYRRPSYMCISLKAARYDGLISNKEYELATSAITEYIKSTYTLSAALLIAGLPDSYDHTLAIYKNWDARPNLNN